MSQQISEVDTMHERAVDLYLSQIHDHKRLDWDGHGCLPHRRRARPSHVIEYDAST